MTRESGAGELVLFPESVAALGAKQVFNRADEIGAHFRFTGEQGEDPHAVCDAVLGPWPASEGSS